MSDPSTSTTLRYFGDYVLLGEIARGGMGVVHRAQQTKLNRPVALKMLRAGALAGATEVQRFRTEAEAAANLDHPHIVPIYEVGEHEGQHFFSMKLIDGESLAERLKDPGFRLPDRAVAQLTATVARAVHHAHQRGVLHRDLKPGNILLDEQAQPHVTDFGLAKLLDTDHGQTRSDSVLGTPAYMSPEQASGQSKTVTCSTDIYSLGAILYELLAGRPPFAGATVLETLRKVMNEEPVPPGRYTGEQPEADVKRKTKSVNRVDRDLETICLKCLEKTPARRYASAESLAEDLDRWLNGEPIHARPVTDGERLGKWVRRHPVTAALSAAVAISLCAGLVTTTWQWRRADFQRQRAEEQGTRLRLQRAEDHFSNGRAELALAELARLLRDQPANRSAAERLVNTLNQRTFLVVAGNAAPSPARREGVTDLSLDGKTRATVRDAVTIELWSGNAGVPSRSISNAHTQVIRSLRFDARGERLVSAAADGTVRIWSAPEGRLLASFTNGSPIYFAELSPNGSNLVTAVRHGIVSVHDLSTGRPVGEPMRHPGPVNAARFSPDGRWLVTASDDKTVRVWDAATGRSLSEPARLAQAVEDARFIADGRRIVAQLADGTALTLRMTSPLNPSSAPPFDRKEPADLASLRQQFASKHSGQITFAERSADGTRLATASTDQTARLWNARNGEPRTEPLPHDATVNCVRFSPDGRRVATSTAQPTRVRVWDAQTGLPLCDWLDSSEPVSDIRFSEDGGWLLASAGWKWPLHRAESAASPWLANLAEAVAGTRINAAGLSESVPATALLRVRDSLAREPRVDSFTQWAREFLRDENEPAQR